MENAAKALLIAGGVLIALMVLTILVYAMTAKSRIEKAEYEKIQTEKIAKFNSEYEVYNKNRLYGIDVISVINKAIAHNKRMRASSVEDKYFINVIFVTTQDNFQNEVYKIDNTQQVKEEKKLNDTEVANLTDAQLTSSEIAVLKSGRDAKIEKNKINQLGEFVGSEFVESLDFKKIFGSSINDVIITTSDGKRTYKLYSALTNFKKAVFACTNSNYDSSTGGIVDETSNGITYKDGRVQEIRFVQVKSKL